MKILSRTQVETSKQNQLEKTIEQGANIANEVDRVRRKLVAANDIYEKTVKRQEAELEKNRQFAFRQQEKLKEEITALEKKRNELMKPLDALIADINRIKAETDEKSKKLDKDLEDTEQLKNKLFDKLQDNDIKMSNLEIREEQIARKEVAIADKELFINTSIAELTSKWALFEQAVAERKTQLANERQQNELTLREIQTKQKLLADERESLNIYKAKLDSRQATMQIAYEELKNKENEK